MKRYVFIIVIIVFINTYMVSSQEMEKVYDKINIQVLVPKETINESESFNIKIVIENKSAQAVSFESYELSMDKNMVDQGEIRVNEIIEPYHTITIDHMGKSRDRIYPGEIKAYLMTEFLIEDVTFNKFLSFNLSFNIDGAKEILETLKISTIHYLPGFIGMALYLLIYRKNKKDEESEKYKVIIKGGLLVVYSFTVIMIYGLFAVDFWDGAYNFTDFLIFLGFNIVLGLILVGVIRLTTDKFKDYYLISIFDNPNKVIKKLATKDRLLYCPNVEYEGTDDWYLVDTQNQLGVLCKRMDISSNVSSGLNDELKKLMSKNSKINAIYKTIRKNVIVVQWKDDNDADQHIVIAPLDKIKIQRDRCEALINYN